MANVDDKVVAMSFEGNKFESGVSRALDVLDKLKKSLNLDGAGKGLKDIDAAAKQMDLSHISKGVDEIRNKFSALSIAAIAVLSNIAIKAASAGAQVVKSFTLQPIIDGFHEYETQLNAVQTILANTAAAGTGLNDVNAALNQLNIYADKTIYNFSEMARNIGTFTAAGVDLQTSVNSIKGIANLAALSGSNSQQAATAMYQLSQAISAGRVSLMDWNSVVNAGMGGTVFQRALAQTAVQMGTLSDGALKLVGPMKNVSINGESFRQSLSSIGPNGESWLTGEVLTKTLSQLSGNLSDAQLKAEGYSDAQIKAIQQQAKMALEAATQVKTFSQLLSTAQEALSSGWAKTFQIIFGNFGEAKALFTSVSNVVNEIISNSADARNKVLSDWKRLGGRTLLIDSISTAFESLGKILGSVKDAFRDIFPAKTGQDLFGLTKSFSNLVNTLKPSEETLNNLRRTFAGVFAVLDIGKEVVNGIFSVFGRLFTTVLGGSGSFLELTATIGDFLVELRNTIKQSGFIEDFFNTLGDILTKPIELIQELSAALADLFSDKSSGGISGSLGALSSGLAPLQGVVSGLTSAWDDFTASVSGSQGIFDNAVQAMATFFSGLGTAIAGAFQNVNWDSVIAVINTGLFAALVLAFKKFFGKGSLLEQISGKGGFLRGLTGIFDGVTGSLTAMQQSLKARAIRDIAIAIALLAGSLFILSLIPADKMNVAMTGLITAMGALVGAMALLNKVAVGPGFLKLPVIAAGFILLAIAVGLLAVSVKGLSTMSWEELTKGLTGVSVLLAALSVAAGPLSKASIGLVGAGVGITAIAVAMKILASAVKDFGNLSWEQLGKGMVSIAGALVAIGAAARLFPPGMVLIGAGLIAVSVGLKIIAGVMQDLAKLSWEQIGKGLAVIAGSLLAIGAATQLMGPSLILIGPGLIAVAIAMKILGKAIAQMGGMSIEQIAKGLGTLAGALIILAGALYLMSGTLGGAAALTVAAAGIAILAPALKMLGNQSWTEIIKGMVALASAIGILAAASVLLGGAVPAMLAMGAALLLIGAGLALAGAGIFLIGLGLAAIATSGTAAIAVLIGGLDMLMDRLPQYVESMTKAFIQMALSFAKAAPKMIQAVGKILIALSQAIIAASPQLVAAAVVLISNLLVGLRALGPQIVATGMSLLLDLLRGIRENIGQIVALVADIIANFLRALGANAGKIVAAGVDMIVSLLRGISNNISKVPRAALEILVKFLQGITQGLSRVITAGANIIIKLVTGIGNQASRLVAAGTNAIVKFITGVGNAGPRIVTAAVNAAAKFVRSIAQGAVKLADEGAKAIILFLNGVADVIEKREPEMIGAGARIGKAIIKGLVQGLVNFAQEAYDKAREIADKVIDIIKDPFGIFSPSKTMHEVGGYIIEGLANGMGDTAPKAYKSAEVMSKGVIAAVKQVFGISSPSKVMKKLGQFIGDGFLEGLKGSQQSIRQAVLELNQQLSQAVQNAKAEISVLRESIRKEKEKDKPDQKAIDAANAAIERNQRLIKLASAANKELIKGLVSERAHLSKLAKQYSELSVKIEAAAQALEDAKKLRDDAASDIAGDFGSLPSMLLEDDADPSKLLENYKKSLTNQTNAVTKYSQTLDQLRALGLNDELYQKLVDEGVGAQEFASQLLAGGQAAVSELNSLDTGLSQASHTLGVNVSRNMYQAGVDAAQGLLNGLISQQKAIADQMGVIAREIVKAIRKKLRIKSPSRVMDELGRLTGQGFADGISKSKALVNGAAESMIDSMKDTMAGLSDILSSEIDATPQITPVVDLTNVQKSAADMQNILGNVVDISAAASYNQAASISDQQRKAVSQAVEAAQVGTTYNFEQNNYSPKALSVLEVYRQTRNQLAQAKSN